MINSAPLDDEFYPKPLELSPIQRLCEALLCSAIKDYHQRSTSSRAQALERDAAQWICSESDEIFSFNMCCEQLGLNPSATKKAILSEKAKRLNRIVLELNVKKKPHSAKICAIDKCAELVECRGLCMHHYQRFHKIVRRGAATWENLARKGYRLPDRRQNAKREKRAAI